MALTDQEYRSVTAPIEVALGLPNRAYTDEAFLQDEFEKVLGGSSTDVASFESRDTSPLAKFHHFLHAIDVEVTS